MTDRGRTAMDGPGRDGRRLLVAIHDVAPPFEAAVDQLCDLIAPLIGGPKLAMLVVPHHWAGEPLAAAPAFQRRLRAWSDAGVEMFLHGWLHRDDSSHAGRVARFKARHMTASEGEFLGLSEAEARRRIAAGRALVEDCIGRPVTGFIAPAWLYGPGAHGAMAALGLGLAEDHMRVWDPRDGRVHARGPVITWASRSRWRTASSLAVATVARHAHRPLRTARIAVHPGDVTKPVLIDSIAATVRAMTRGRRVARYAELAAEARAA
ncbi:polysaccharide deacetylase family protein [Sphingomonas morindae]|uniref:Polysaccharide deacetylase family protein n=1 Tax=Sphingomonas morindae TaxID=1541170 RepID=A0ABY4X577_9SPHN|nr:polysaccharide deacetylase family protein [Sphingomonas morindae]USI72059.1 polysaccharide deacetylase family protein [Sphingomonas morindae]